MTDLGSPGLRWVADEIGATLEMATAALAAYLRAPAERHHLQFCQAHLHEVAGSLILAQSLGGTLLTNAMEAVVAALLRAEIANPELAGEALAAAAAALPGYLQRSLTARRERPESLITLLNDLRALLHQPLASEGGLFAADLTTFDARSQTLPPTQNQAELAALCRKLRQVYQHALLALLKGEQVERQLELLAKVGQRMRELFPGSRRQLLWEVYGAVLTNLGALPRLGAAQRQLLWQLDRDLRACGDIGDTDAEQPTIAPELFKNLLYYAMADGRAAGGHLGANFALDLDAETSDATAETGDPWDLPGPALRSALGSELLSELGALRQLGENEATHKAAFITAAPRLATPLRRLRDTLIAAGLGKAVAAIEHVLLLLERTPGASPADAAAWAEWAQAIERLDRLIQVWVTSGTESDDPEVLWAALVAEARAAALAPIRGLLDEIKEALIGHASTRGEASRLEVATAHAEQISLALQVIGMEVLSAVLADCRTYLAQWQKAAAPLPLTDLDCLADCLIAAEHHLDLVAQGDIEAAASALAQAQQRAARLRNEPPPAQPVAPVEPAAEPVAQGAAPAVAATPSPAPAQAEGDIDLEIREIFIEEAREVLATIAQLDAGTATTPPRALADLRRGFHTLKGSGRMVGATAIGELSWAVENLLNRILEASIPWSSDAARVIAQALARLPILVDELAGGDSGTTIDANDAELRERAGSLAAGTTAPTAPEAASIDGGGAPEAPDTTTPGLPADFRAEALAQIAVLEQFVAARRSAGVGLGPEVAARAIHTLIGCCERVGHPALSRALRALEGLVTVHAERGLAPAAEMLEVIDALSAIGRQLITTGDDATPAIAALQEQLDRQHLALASSRQPRERLRAAMAGSLNELLAASEWLERAPDAGLPWERLRGLLGEFGVLMESADAAALPGLAMLAGLLRGCGQRLLDGRSEASAGIALREGTALREGVALREGIAQLLAMLDAVAAALPPPELSADLQARLEAVAATPVEPAAGATASVPERRQPMAAPIEEELSGELVGIFLEEATDLCEQIERAITRWRDGLDPAAQSDALKRSLHTLKGSARMAGCTALGAICHDFETLVLDVDPSATPADFWESCLHWYDRIEQERERIARTGATHIEDQARPPEQVPKVAPAAAAPPAVPPTVSPTAPSPAAPSVPPPRRAIAALARAATPPPWRQALRQTAAPHSDAGHEPREMVKIAAPILDNLIHLADETSVGRSRIEQQLQQFHFQLEEMETTVARSHNQVRRLGTETEAQILFRREQLTSDGLEEQFDPLEMDRYSNLQQLSRALEESASDLQDLKETLLAKVREIEVLLLQQARVNRDLQENLSLTRMVPFSRVVPRLRRIARQTSSELDKPVELLLNNVEGEMDRSVLERVVPSLEHLIRNAIDHGIESPGERERAGKPTTGRISITFAREAGDVVIKLADDGRGLNLEAIRTKALSLGLIGATDPVDARDLAQLIFHPGFSTAANVSQISGRGIGMEVVDSELRQLGGSVTPLSRSGQGTEFSLRLPFTISVNRALLMKAGRERYGTLVNSVAGVVRLDAGQLEQVQRHPEAGFDYQGESYRICRLDDLVGNREPPTSLVPGRAALVLTKEAREQAAVLVDALEPSQEVVVKALGPQFSKVRGLTGATVLGDGQVVPILDLNALFADRTAPWLGAPHATETPQGVGREAIADAPITVLVVDDSVTMRKATARLLERQGHKVITARDGVEAVQLLQEITPDLMLLDIEMPRMDGFEVARQVRATERLARLPIIMITSRSGDKHRNKALELGVNHYLGKPYQEENLLAAIDATLLTGGSVPHAGGAVPHAGGAVPHAGGAVPHESGLGR